MDEQSNRTAPRHVIEALDASVRDIAEGRVLDARAVQAEARRMLAESGRYRLVDVSNADAKPVKEKSLRNCEGCAAGIALQLGADQSLIGVVTRVTQTDYYVSIQISDARTGKVLDQQEANFAGAADGWASGVRMLIKHQVLASDK